jgi:hypothetical protein
MPLYPHPLLYYFAMECQTTVRLNLNPRCVKQLSLCGNFFHSDGQVAQRQGAKATLKPVPPKVLSMFERAVEEQVPCILLYTQLLRHLTAFLET